MKITFKIDKRHLAVVALLLVLAFAAGVFAAQSFNRNLSWHRLQQVVTDESGTTSVDANSNGIIDAAETGKACNSDSVCEVQSLRVSQICDENGANCKDISGGW